MNYICNVVGKNVQSRDTRVKTRSLFARFIFQTDCIDSVFSFLNQVDLDDISHVSQTIHRHVNRSRPKVPKSFLFEFLKLKQSSPDVFNLQLLGEDRAEKLSVDLTGNRRTFKMADHMNRFLKRQEDKREGPIELEAVPIPPTIFNKFEFLVQRYDVVDFVFSKIVIDDHFMSNFEKWVGCCQICIIDGKFGDEFQKKRFAKLLIVNCIPGVSLIRSEFAKEIDNSFIEEMSRLVTNPRLNVSDHEDLENITVPEEEMKEMDKATLDVLFKFDAAAVTYMRIDADWIMEAIIKRLRRETPGGWEFTLSRMLLIEDISTSIENETDLEIDALSEQGSRTIRMRSNRRISVIHR